MAEPLGQLAAAANKVAEGDYQSAKEIYAFTKPGAHSEDVQNLAEAIGMMAVKVEAREFRLERALEEIRRTNVALLEASQTRAEFGTMASFIIIVLSLYTISLAFMQNVIKLDINLRRTSVEGISFGFLVLQIAMALAFTMKHRPKPYAYGWTMRNWKKSLLESAGWSVAVLAVLVCIKLVLIRMAPTEHQYPVFDWGYWGGWMSVVMYLFVAPSQELVGRGFLQNSIEKFLTGKTRTWLAIVLTSVQFGVVHLHFSFATGIIAMLSGLLFGTMFARQRTLVGVSVAHFVLGTMAFGPLRLMGL
jgi:membrane protease YdiL (CAAX protease family)